MCDIFVLIPLDEARDNESCVIASIQIQKRRGPKSHLFSHQRHRRFESRLIDMGLTPGTVVIVVKSAPFHGPIEVMIRGSRLALGRRMAHHIFVNVNREKKDHD
jgi:Fe2+ transport system protein FeoA